MEPEQKHAACTWLARVVPRKQEGGRVHTVMSLGSKLVTAPLTSAVHCAAHEMPSEELQKLLCLRTMMFEWRKEMDFLCWLPSHVCRHLPPGAHPSVSGCCIYIIPQTWTKPAPAPPHLYLRALTRSVQQTRSISRSRKQEAEACLVKYRVI